MEAAEGTGARQPFMKTLTLLRHAKSSWDDPVERDFDRPLNARGRRAAARIGRYMREQGLAFDLVYASPAVRVRQTIEGVEDGYGAPLRPIYEMRVYMASASTLAELVQRLPGSVSRALLIGHNPGLEELALQLTGAGDPRRGEVEIKYPTATLAEIEFDVDSWAEVAEGRGRLSRFMRPRELDPSLGPDET